jgi:hypothetical protein
MRKRLTQVTQNLDRHHFIPLTSSAMTPASVTDSKSRPFLGRTNVILLAAAVVSLGLGYMLLQNGGTTVAAALLVLGYCVLFPLGIAL